MNIPLDSRFCYSVSLYGCFGEVDILLGNKCCVAGIGNKGYILLGKNLLALSTEVVEAEVTGCIHSIVAGIAAGQVEAKLGYLAKARKVYIAPIVNDIGCCLVAQICQIVFLGTCYFVLGIIACYG